MFSDFGRPLMERRGTMDIKWEADRGSASGSALASAVIFRSSKTLCILIRRLGALKRVFDLRSVAAPQTKMVFKTTGG